MRKKTIYIALLIFFLVTLACLSFIKQRQLQKKKNAWGLLDKKLQQMKNTFLGQAGIVVKDLSRGRQISINGDKLFPAASLTKIPIMASYFYASAQKKIDLNKALVLENRFKALGSGILKNCPASTSLSIEKLLELMIAESDNTACNMLIDYLGFDYLNNAFKILGLKNTNIARKMMDFTSRRNGDENYTTAVDMAFILEKIYHGRAINKYYSRRGLALLKKQKIRDRLPAKLPPNLVVAHKTGLERGACHDVGIIFTSQGNFLICVLTKHRYETSKAAKQFISQLALEVYNYAEGGS